MAKEIKKVGLLKDVDNSKKPVSTSATTENSATTNANTAAQPQVRLKAKGQTETKSFGKIGLIALSLFLIVIVMLPKPELIVYRKMNIQASSVYWPGLFGSQARLLDSDLQVSIDANRNEMNLCFEIKSKTDCQTFIIERRDGLFGVIGHLMQ
jgi:hypothetical protein